MWGTPLQVIHHLVAVLISDGGHHHYGNGRHNRNVVSVRSPTHNHGYQHTTNGNAGGTNPTQNGLCRQVTVCNITQKITIVQPERPATPPPPVSPAPVQALPMTTAVPRPRPQVESTARGPFISMGPSGFLLMAPDSPGFGFG